MNEKIKDYTQDRDERFGKFCDANIEHWKETVLGIMNKFPDKESAATIIAVSIRAIKFQSLQQGHKFCEDHLMSKDKGN